MMMEQQPQRVQMGERLFLLSLFAVIGVETVTTIITATNWFEWTSLALGVGAFLAILHFAARIYDGDGKSLGLLRLLVCIILALSGLGLVLLLAGNQTMARMLGVNLVWLTCLKMTLYGLFAAVLFSPGNFVDFLAARRGESLERAPATGPALDLPADQSQTFGGMVNVMRGGAVILLLAGAVEVLLALQNTYTAPGKSLLDLIGGFAAMCLGAMLYTTANRFRAFLDMADRNGGHLAQTIAALGTFLKAQIVLGLITGLVLALRLAYLLF